MSLIKRIFLSICIPIIGIGLLIGTLSAKEFLPPEQAFVVEATWVADANELLIDYRPAKGYYIYQESLQYRLFINNQKINTKNIQLPRGVEKFDETFGKKMEIYPKPFQVIIPFTQKADQGIRLELDLQGCADGGICYPPMTYQYFIAAPGVKVAPIPEAEAKPSKEGANIQGLSLIELWSGRDDVGSIKSYLENANLGYLLVGFFVLGLALAFTPCVLPMLPILSSIVLGKQSDVPISKIRSAYLALSYILGMALLYALAGILTAALGSGVQRVLQSPIALILFSGLLLFLAGTLFGFYELKMPQVWQDKVDQIAGRQKGGSLFGAFVLGAISTLVASPCITAPLASVLGFVAQTGSMALGGALLFVMALGMGLPLSPNLVFQVVRSPEELQIILQKAQENKKPVLLDFYADWCISCKEMEAITFANPEIAKEMGRFVLVQADVTLNNPSSQALLKQYGLFGPPAILLFNSFGEEQKALRIIGFMPPTRFSQRLQELNTK